MQAIGIEVIPFYLDPSLFNSWPDGDFWISNFDIAELANSQCGSLEDTTCVPYSWFVTNDPGNVMGYHSAVADTLYANAQAASSLEDKRYYAIQHQAVISQDLPVLPIFTRVPGFLIQLPVVVR
jgi:ABC-type oligopeptide transport system substrate-binding subunit